MLGSSTAAGHGPVDKNNAWVARFGSYLRTGDASHKLVNLAKGGYVTYQAMPTGNVPPSGVTYMPDTMYNITRALSLAPDAIIINFPSNDISKGISIDQQIENYHVMISQAAVLDVPVWICTSQPVNYGTSQSSRDKIKALKERIQSEFQEMSIDFYTGLCDESGKILPQYDSGDGLHLSDSAHAILFERVLDADILVRIGYNPDDAVGNQQHLHPILIDFGSSASPAPWNNITTTSVYSVGSFVENLKDINGDATGISLEVSKSFYGMNTIGPSVTYTSLDLPSTASADNFYTGGGYGELFITGLNENQYYNFVFFGSRIDIGGLSRETRFTVRGLNTVSGQLETINNYTNLLLLEGIQPAANKSLIIEVTNGEGNLNSKKYAHLSAIKMVPEIINNTEQWSDKAFFLWFDGGRVYATTTEKGILEIYSLTGILRSAIITTGDSRITELNPLEKGLLIVHFESETGSCSQKILFN